MSKATVAVLSALGALAVMSGCSENASKAADQPTHVASTARSVRYVEPQDCRDTLNTVSEILDSMERNSLSYYTFKGQFSRIERLQKRADTTCSGKVMVGLTKGTWHFSLVNFYWGVCGDPGTNPCRESHIVPKIRKAIAEQRGAVKLAGRTE